MLMQVTESKSVFLSLWQDYYPAFVFKSLFCADTGDRIKICLSFRFSNAKSGVTSFFSSFFFSSFFFFLNLHENGVGTYGMMGVHPQFRSAMAGT